jgi:tRNA-specific 2-thiouridylase
MCNQEVKFKLFLQACLEDGADLIATGHYARVTRKNDKGELHIAANKEKDQTYFLYRVSSEALAKTLMPIGDFTTKDEVRAVAKKFGLATASKKDSQGICFVGKVGIKDFLLHELGPQTPGLIIEQNGVAIGQHDGAIFYTIGQRHGLDVGGGLPYYVVGKDMAKNEVYVTTNLDDDKLWNDKLKLVDLHWINDQPKANKTYQVRTRYRAALVDCQLEGDVLKLADQVRAVTPGQSAVLYDGDQVLGGGIVTRF